jgi:hypothetical protein
MRIRLAIPDRLVTPEALEAALEATTLANEQAIAAGEVPTLSHALSRGLKWKPEPFTDGEHFDLAHQVASRNWGDCDDLAPWLASELRASGDDPGARPRVYQSGPNRWHVVVQTSDGKILDPSRWAGMKKDGGPGVSGTVARPMARSGQGALVVSPSPDGRQWWARCDLPWNDADGHIASHARCSTPERALIRAIDGAVACGDEIDSPLCDRAIAAGELLLAHPGEVGSIFSSLGKIAKGAFKAVAPIASSIIPGGGLATTALSALTKGGGGKKPPGAIQHPSGVVSVPLEKKSPGHGQHMMISYHPAGNPGPVVMRF